MTRYMAHPIPKRNVHIPAAANAPHISLHNLIRKAGGGGGLISCWCWNVEMLPGATGVTIIRGRPHWAAQAAGTGGLVLLRAHIGAGEGWWGAGYCGQGERHVASVCWTFLAAGDIVCWTLLGQAEQVPGHHQPGDSSILEF